MSRFSESDVDEIVLLLTEGLVDAGFTGTKIERATLPQASWEIFTRESRTDEEVEPMPAGFSQEILYHRVTTDQGSFGLWLEPFFTLDLKGSGVEKAFLTDEAKEDPTLIDWCFVVLEENTFMRLFIEFTKKSRQP
jgi:hypothetical protein